MDEARGNAIFAFGELQRAVMQTLFDPLVVIDHEGRVVEFNRAAEWVFGHRRDEIIGRELAQELIPPEHRERHRTALARAVEVGETRLVGRRMRMWALHRDGHRIPFDVAIARVAGVEPPMFVGHMRDVSAEEAEADRRRTATRRLATLVANLNSGVLIEDETRHIVLVNDAFCQMWSIPAAPADLVGADCTAAARQSMPLLRDGEAFIAGVDELIAAQEPRHGDTVEFADGRTFERDYLPVSFEGSYRGHMWQYRDVTDRYRKELELKRDRDQALEVSKLKSDFLTFTSHEIRTPMHGVLGTVDLLLDGELQPEQRELALVVKDSAEALLGIINDILDLSRIEAGHFELESGEVDLRLLVGRVCELTGPGLAGKDVALGCHVDPRIDGSLGGDAKRVTQVLSNLVGNAAKFTERGEVTVEAQLLAQSETTQTIRVSVTDTGAGIAGDADVFESFVRSDAASTVPGTGLGLAIAKRLVEAMDGTIDYESTPGRGSAFSITVTLDRSGEAFAWPSADVSTALVVGGPPRTRLLLRRQLEQFGVSAQVIEKASGPGWPPEGFKPEIVFLLPGAGELVDHPALEGASVIEVGYGGPVSFPLTLRRLAKLMTVDVPPVAEAEPRPLSGVDGVILVVEDNDVNLRLALMQLASLGVTARAAHDGEEAVEVFRSTPPGGFAGILMDCQMPRTDGFEATRRIRETEAERGQSERVPIIALTAGGTPLDRKLAIESGMDQVLLKPITRDRLVTALEEWCGTGAAQAPDSGEPSAVDSGHLETLVHDIGDRAAVGRVVESFLLELPGREQSIDRACEERDAETLAKFAHGLKGTCAAVGANASAELCASIESAAHAGEIDTAVGMVRSLHGKLRDAERELERWAV